MKRALLLLTIFGPAVLAQTNGRSQALCAQIQPIAQQLTIISGMPLKHPVPCDFISKQKIEEFLNKRVKDVAKPEEIRAEELTLKKFGLVPPDFNLARNTVDLLPNRPRPSTITTENSSSRIPPSENQEPVLAHEIAHAIADRTTTLQSSSGRAARAMMAPRRAWR
jgi:hypothetical protein